MNRHFDGMGPDPFGEGSVDGDDRGDQRVKPLRRAELRILLVDETACMRRMLRNLLMDIGCRHISEASEGLSALTSLHNQRVDFLICDLDLPEMTGLDLLRAIRADKRLWETPVLMTASQANREDISHAAQAGVNGFLLKPFTAAMLEKKLAAMLACFSP
ncbi:Response regulator receiver domain protein [Spongiibacter sp. IMCC21906]|jgi:two-component system chemotaxis response regulator CheY|uniref:response regulator n=1 Tax=Spongiibacter sp. IMCC21906 TaxID=1620392 RepID=UPI00062DE19B|nr:Response regulator receiver domain protein [Spongiibacter sp. IMCC21906]